MREKTATIRFDRSGNGRVIVYYKTQRVGEARVLDLIANGKLKRCSRKQKEDQV
jgi:hypothetical protein